VPVDATVKVNPLLADPPTVTTTGPVLEFAGTGTTMLVLLQLIGVAVVPLNVTVLVPRVVPKPVPFIVTKLFTPPDVGDRLLMTGTTVKVTPLLAKPPTVTTTGPGVAFAGTGTRMLVLLQLVGVAAVPLNVTVLVPCEPPNVVPLIVTEAPTWPEVGDRLVMLGGTVKATPLLANPPTVTTTGPVVAFAGTGATMLVLLQLLGVAAVPLNVTVLVPCEVPKLEPLIVTAVPTAPEVGERLLMLGATVNVTPLLATPPTVTTTGPVVAPMGTGATMLVLLQLVGAAVVPLKVTLFVPWVAPKFDPLIVIEVPHAPELGERLVILGGGGCGTTISES